jgi:UDP-N-acetylglucosamine--N-acetylmuramyl-(pentapeptide) pyrophosphoryl-undecaprenol N-acetylglucosamine transferase
VKRIIISGGGTGGHIFPAIAIANEFRCRCPEIDILFVGAEGRMEMEKVPAAGYNIMGLPIMGLPRKLSLKMFKFVINYFKSIRLARKIIRDFKPDFVVGVGSYASFPALNAASKLGIPYFIQEQNSYSGKSNKKVAKKATKIFVAYNNMERFFPADKIILVGNPVRNDILNVEHHLTDAYKFFNFSPTKKTLLIIGGSLGAKTINKSVAKDIQLILENDIQIIWQCGQNYLPEAKKYVEAIHANVNNIFLSDFIYKMDYAYSVVVVIISRAGASSISELCIVGKPAVLVPSPNVAEDHQTKNALAIVNANAAIIVKDDEAYENLIPTTIALLNDEKKCEILADNIIKLALPNATSTIINEIEKLMAKNYSAL